MFKIYKFLNYFIKKLMKKIKLSFANQSTKESVKAAISNLVMARTIKAEEITEKASESTHLITDYDCCNDRRLFINKERGIELQVKIKEFLLN